MIIKDNDFFEIIHHLDQKLDFETNNERRLNIFTAKQEVYTAFEKYHAEVFKILSELQRLNETPWIIAAPIFESEIRSK